jgi:succinate dehydrogenase / fumarate reductase cytochrome b subunit
MYEKTNLIHNRRPLSPHLTIYKPQISSLTSIAHRISGVFLFIGIIAFTWWLAAVVFCPEVVKCEFLKSDIMKFMLISWSFALYYHFLNGIRHLFWDAGKGFEIKTMNASGMFVIFSSLALTVLTWFFVCDK